VEVETPQVQQVAAPVNVFYDQSARGLMCRELHGPFFLRISVERKTKNARTMLFFFHFLPPRLSTG
jgi:hypothetical protein